MTTNILKSSKGYTAILLSTTKLKSRLITNQKNMTIGNSYQISCSLKEIFVLENKVKIEALFKVRKNFFGKYTLTNRLTDEIFVIKRHYKFFGFFGENKHVISGKRYELIIRTSFSFKKFRVELFDLTNNIEMVSIGRGNYIVKENDTELAAIYVEESNIGSNDELDFVLKILEDGYRKLDLIFYCFCYLTLKNTQHLG